MVINPRDSLERKLFLARDYEKNLHERIRRAGSDVRHLHHRTSPNTGKSILVAEQLYHINIRNLSSG
jgi:hypothetical protein